MIDWSLLGGTFTLKYVFWCVILLLLLFFFFFLLLLCACVRMCVRIGVCVVVYTRNTYIWIKILQYIVVRLL